MARNRFFVKIGIIIPFLPIFLMSQNTFAASLTALPSGRFYRAWSQNSGNTWQHNANYTDWALADLPISALSANATYDRYVKGFRVVGNPPEASSTYTVNQITEISVIFKQLGTYGDCSGGNNMSPTLNYASPFIPVLRYISGNSVLETETFNSDNFKCYEEISGNGNAIFEFKFDGFSTTDNSPINGIDFRWGDALTTPTVNSPVGIAGICKTGTFETNCFLGNTIQFMGITYKYTLSNDPAIIYQNTIINQNNTQINQNQQIIDHNNKEEEAADNIENQSPNDINNASNAATTNLIGILSNFVSQLSSFSATNCNVTIPFPVFLGGNKVVNICQNKDKAGDLISIIGSLILIGFYIPLAIVLLKMIYGEIRSFTNG